MQFFKYKSNDDLPAHGLVMKDIYQTFNYNMLEGKRTGTEPWFFLYKTDEISIALPLLLDIIPESISSGKKLKDAKSSYGYAGLVFSEIPTSEQLHNFFNALFIAAEQEKIVSIFIRMHPYYNQLNVESTEFVSQLIHGKTSFVNLTEGIDEITAHYSSTHSRGIKTLKQNNYYGRINNWEDYQLFQSAYQETMTYVQAGAQYFFEKNYFDELRSNLHDGLHIINVYDNQNQYATGALFMAFGDIVQYHLGGTFNIFRKMAPSKLVFDIAIRYFAELNFSILHLGGGVGSSADSLFDFKKGFGRHTLNFSSVRCIIMPEEYDALVEKHLPDASVSDKNFFPLYRL